MFRRRILLAALIVSSCATTPPLRDYRDAEALSDRALAMMTAGDDAGAIKLLNRVIAYNGGEVRDLTRRAAAYGMLGQYTPALRDLNDAASRDPRQWSTYLMRGVAHQKTGDYADAVQDFSMAIELKPADPELLRQRAYARLLAEDFVGAAQDFGRLSTLKPGSDVGAFGHAVALYLAGNWADAAAAFDAQLRKNPNDGIAALWLAKTSLRSHTPLAWEQLAGEAGPEPEWTMARDLLSNLSTRQVIQDVAALQRPQSDRRTVGTCEAALFFGTWYDSRGLYDQARPNFKAALAACPDDSVERVEARTALLHEAGP